MQTFTSFFSIKKTKIMYKPVWRCLQCETNLLYESGNFDCKKECACIVNETEGVRKMSKCHEKHAYKYYLTH